jgi:biopolymer transport protein ExbD
MARATPEIPNASMADIAFLLLTFFLMTTTVANDKGIMITLPPPPEALPPTDVKIQEKNLFKVQANSFDKVLVEGEPWFGSDEELKERIKTFVLNNGADPESSDNPVKAIVSFKTDRGTSHEKFIELLDVMEAAYNEIYSSRAGVSIEKWREISSDPNNPNCSDCKAIYDKGRGLLPNGQVEIPKNISIAEPSKIGG